MRPRAHEFEFLSNHIMTLIKVLVNRLEELFKVN